MPKKIYVGNLPFEATEEELRSQFGQHGEVLSVKLITDRHTGQPRGFGFVEMEDAAADQAIKALDGTDFGGRSLKVSPARQQGGPGGRGRRPGGRY
jgi:RNA recognition motif-containing protein